MYVCIASELVFGLEQGSVLGLLEVPATIQRHPLAHTEYN